jgi:opacity protein-like surface antigen
MTPRLPFLRIFVLTVAVVFGLARPAHADLTAFLGLSPTPDNRGARGFAGGLTMVVIGFEGEYSQIQEDEIESLPSLRTWSGNVFVQTPVEISKVTPYATVGAGVYRETLAEEHETNIGVNVGGGLKIRLAGPFRVRLDYRVFTLKGDPLNSTYQRFYAGANLAF